MSTEVEVQVENGKYTFVVDELGHVSVDRYSEEWFLEATPANAIISLVREFADLRAKVGALVALHGQAQSAVDRGQQSLPAAWVELDLRRALEATA